MGISEGHRILVTPEEIASARSLDRAWTAPEIARQQRELADRELARWSRGESVAPFDAYWSLIEHHCHDVESILDVGCGSGYYASVLAMRSWTGDYVGIDYSQEMICFASALESRGSFRVADARALPYSDRAFPLVISGCMMLHVATENGWRESLSEAARVSSKWVMAHKTPLIEGPSVHMRKMAYGVECYECWFGEREFRNACSDVGLDWIDERVCSTMPGGRWTSVMLRKR